MNLLSGDKSYLILDPYLHLDDFAYDILPFSSVKFPGGEPHIKIKYVPEHVVILSRIATFDDIGLLLVAVDALRRRTPNVIIDLSIPYFPGARQDRVRNYGWAEPLTVAVYADIINSMKLDHVTIFDPHSDVCPALIHNCVIVYNYDYVRSCISDINDDWVYVIPDTGAGKKAYDLIATLPNKPLGIVTCAKHRNMDTGDITGTEIISGREMIKEHTCVIVDDICDGGHTFTEIAKLLNQYESKNNVLIVSHGIFSKGLKPLSRSFSRIYTTNSVLPLDTIYGTEQLFVYNIFTGKLYK